MKRPSKRKSKARRSLQRSSPLTNSRSLEFPELKGRIVEKIQVFTKTDHHSITIDFRDGTSLVLNIEPCFFLEPSLRLVKQGNEEVTRTWPLFRSATEIA